MLKYMLGIDIVIHTIKHRPSKVCEAFKWYDGQMCISSVTWGELVYGAERSSQPERDLADIEAMAAWLEALPFTGQAATHFASCGRNSIGRASPSAPMT